MRLVGLCGGRVLFVFLGAWWPRSRPVLGRCERSHVDAQPHTTNHLSSCEPPTLPDRGQERPSLSFIIQPFGEILLPLWQAHSSSCLAHCWSRISAAHCELPPDRNPNDQARYRKLVF